MGKNKAFQYNPDTNSWEKVGRRRTKALLGEQNMGFYMGERGYFVIEGPSGAAGHDVNHKGFDMVAYNPETRDLIIDDNKALRRTSPISSASALETHLEENLEGLIQRLEKSSMRERLPHAEEILGKLRSALRSVRSGSRWPKGVRLAVSNASGHSAGVGGKLAKAGVEFIDYNALKSVKRTRFMNPELRKVVKGFEHNAARWEKQAAEKITEREAKLIEKRVAKAVSEHAAKFAEKRLPKLIAKVLLNKSAKAAAHRAASLVPVVGWAFDFDDAVHGVEDITRGHVARGLSGIGLSIADVASDFLHLGDAVSGVGGTALSIGAQGAIMVGQLAVEMERAQDKMDELQKEVADKGALPPDQRLRDYYDMDEEAINDLKNDFNQPDDAPDKPVELPPFPDDDEDTRYLPPPLYFHNPPPPSQRKPYEPPEPLIVPKHQAPPPMPQRVPRDFPCV